MEVSADLHFYNDPCMDREHSRIRTLQEYGWDIGDRVELGIRWYVDQSSPNYRIRKQKILIAQNLCVWEPR